MTKGVPLTPEQRQVLSDKAKAQHAARRAAAGTTAVMERPAPAVVEAGADDDIFAGLSAIANRLKKKSEVGSAARDLSQLLDANPELLADEAVQNLLERVGERQAAVSKDGPGSIVGAGNGVNIKPWTWSDINHSKDPNLAPVTWEPRFSGPIIWQGIRQYVKDGVEITTPKVFKMIHDESRRENGLAQEAAEFRARKRNTISDPTILGRDGEFQGGNVRGMVTEGVFLPNAGGFMLPPDQETIDLANKLGGDDTDDGANAE